MGERLKFQRRLIQRQRKMLKKELYNQSLKRINDFIILILINSFVLLCTKHFDIFIFLLLLSKTGKIKYGESKE